jgi:mono/diheme cytochrome c family protein
MRVLAATLGLGAALLLAGCGTGAVAGKGDVNHGRKLFIEGPKGNPGGACKTCHTLGDAGASGKIGPNLDTTFRFARYAANKGDRFCESTIQNVVLDQIKFPSGNNLEPQYVMPANIFKGQDAIDVAAYVGKVAGVDPAKPVDPAGACS